MEEYKGSPAAVVRPWLPSAKVNLHKSLFTNALLYPLGIVRHTRRFYGMLNGLKIHLTLLAKTVTKH